MTPVELVDAHVAARSELLDSEVLAELAAMPALAAAGDPAWADRAYLDGVAYRLAALARIIEQRGLDDALVRERAGDLGDPLADRLLAAIVARSVR